MAQTVPLWLLIATVAVYCGFLIGYGETVFDAPGGDCDGVVDCTTGIFGFIGDLFQFLTLGGFESPIPLLIQGPLLLFFGIAWTVTISNLVIGAVGAVL